MIRTSPPSPSLALPPPRHLLTSSLFLPTSSLPETPPLWLKELSGGNALLLEASSPLSGLLYPLLLTLGPFDSLSLSLSGPPSMATRGRSRSQKHRSRSRRRSRTPTEEREKKDPHGEKRSRSRATPRRDKETRKRSRPSSARGSRRSPPPHRSPPTHRRRENCAIHHKSRHISALNPETWECVPGKECKTENEPNISGIYRFDGTEVHHPLKFFSSLKIIEPFYNRYGVPIENPIAYAAKSLQLSTQDFKGKIKGQGKHSGKKGQDFKGKSPAHKGSRSDQNDFACRNWPTSDVWADAAQVWQEASERKTWPISEPWPSGKLIDPKRKGKGWEDPIGAKGRSGKGKGKTWPDPPPNRKGSGRSSSTISNSRTSVKQEHPRDPSEADDPLDFESLNCKDYNERWDWLKTLAPEEAESWLGEQETIRRQKGAPFPLKWPLPTKASPLHGGPDLESTAHFELAQTWKTAKDKIWNSRFPGIAFCPGCWKKISLKGIELDPSLVEDRVIAHIESKIWDENMSPPQVPLHPSPATWCHLTADRIANLSPDSDLENLEGVPGGVWAGDPSCGY
jgi:hypothetical protein